MKHTIVKIKLEGDSVVITLAAGVLVGHREQHDEIISSLGLNVNLETVIEAITKSDEPSFIEFGEKTVEIHLSDTALEYVARIHIKANQFVNGLVNYLNDNQN